MERAFVNAIFPNNSWRTDICFPSIKIIYFEFCDRGIPCWKKFNIFLKHVFPNLEGLFLSQSWIFSHLHDDVNNSYKFEDSKEANNIVDAEIAEFLKDSWLKYIYIRQSTDSSINICDISDNKIRIFPYYDCKLVCDCCDMCYNFYICESDKYKLSCGVVFTKSDLLDN